MWTAPAFSRRAPSAIANAATASPATFTCHFRVLAPLLSTSSSRRPTSMRRSLVAAVLALAVVVPAAFAQDTVSTRCREIDVALDATHTASKLAGCGDPSAPDLLWHLDRIDQLDGALDGQYHRRHLGAGSVIYVMDTGVLASHAEFAEPGGGTRVIAGFDLTQSVALGASSCFSPNKALQPCYSNLAELI